MKSLKIVSCLFFLYHSGVFAGMGMSTSDDFSPSLCRSANKGEYVQVKRYIDEGKDVNGKKSGGSFCGQTPLHCAVLGNHIDVVKLLVKHSANVNQKSGHGSGPFKTPLHYAAENGKTKILNFLLDHGAKVDAYVYLDKKPPPPLQDDFSFLDILYYRNHVKPRKKASRKTALHFACEKGSSECIYLLLQHDACLASKDEHGETPLSILYKNNKDAFDQVLNFVPKPVKEIPYCRKKRKIVRAFFGALNCLGQKNDAFNIPLEVKLRIVSYFPELIDNPTMFENVLSVIDDRELCFFLKSFPAEWVRQSNKIKNKMPNFVEKMAGYKFAEITCALNVMPIPLMDSESSMKEIYDTIESKIDDIYNYPEFVPDYSGISELFEENDFEFSSDDEESLARSSWKKRLKQKLCACIPSFS